MNEKTPDQADTPGLALDQLRLLGDLLSCLDAAGYDPEDTQQLQLALAARLRPRAGRPLPGPEYDDQALRPEPDEALLDSLDIAALIARSSLGTPSARRIRSMTSAGQITEILRRRGQAATTGHQPPALPEPRSPRLPPAWLSRRETHGRQRIHSRGGSLDGSSGRHRLEIFSSLVPAPGQSSLPSRLRYCSRCLASWS